MICPNLDSCRVSLPARTIADRKTRVGPAILMILLEVIKDEALRDTPLRSSTTTVATFMNNKQPFQLRSLNRALLAICCYTVASAALWTLSDFVVSYLYKPIPERLNIWREFEIFWTTGVDPVKTIVSALIVGILIEISIRLFRSK